MDMGLYRVIDANLNRVREGLRVSEDIARFMMQEKGISKSLKALRHSATNAPLLSKKLRLRKLVGARDTKKDVLKYVDFPKKRSSDYGDILMSNVQRTKESLRVLEECCKIIDEKVGREYRRLRFKTYDIEKKISIKL